MRSIIKNTFLLILFLVTSSAFAEDFLSPEEAFKVVATWNVESKESGSKIAITVAPATGYYVYKESLKVRLDKNTNNDPLAYQLPQGRRNHRGHSHRLVCLQHGGRRPPHAS